MAAGIRGRRWLPSGRTLGIVAVVLAVVAGAGWLAKPVWQPWWYAATLCGGNLSGGELADLLPNERLRAAKDTFGSGRSQLGCGVDESDGRHYVFDVNAEIDTGDPVGPLAIRVLGPEEIRYVYPSSVPGFYGEFGPVIVQECPKLGHDSRGRKRRLVTRVHPPANSPSPQSLRTAVRIANGANTEMGCGADRLPLPDRVEPTRKLSVRQAKGTMCGWLAQATLPRSPSGKQWQVVAPTDGQATITSCSLIDSGTGESAVNLTGWYGNWADRSSERVLFSKMQVPEEYSSHDALLGTGIGRAWARCAGESATFLATSFAQDRSKSTLPMSDVRRLLNAFATDQAEHRDCTGLKLPDRTVHPDAD
uniref:DUF3558 domain-containing protein n=1 Tax=Streptomyces sp. NBC_01401 TaxID=2903854 RepID=A0AAU3H1A1_9ACTN